MIPKSPVDPFWESKDYQDFFAANLSENPQKLILKFGKSPVLRWASEQIAAHQRIKKKIPSWYGNGQLQLPPRLNTEQASSEATARLKKRLIPREKQTVFADLTGGLGIDSYFLGAAFEKRFYIEKDEELRLLSKHNFKVLNHEVTILEGSAESSLEQLPFCDLVYLDPARRDPRNKAIFKLEDASPNVLAMQESLLKMAKRILIKASPMIGINETLSKLSKLKEVWVISDHNDCKEVLFLLESDFDKGLALIRTWNLTNEGLEYFEGSGSVLKPVLAESLGKYIYEPNASVLKADLQDQLASNFNLQKLGLHSHLYVSDRLALDFAGRVWKLEAQSKAYDRRLRGGSYSVIARNFTDKASTIEKKMRLKPHDQHFIIATRWLGKPIFLQASRIS
jgi:16S rRNA G966 N2-methylase RsmD